MFNRVEAKREAREVLSKSYWAIFVVCLLLYIVVEFNVGIKANFSDLLYSGTHYNQWWRSVRMELEFLSYSMPLTALLGFLGYVIFTTIMVVGCLFRIFVGYPLLVGCDMYFVHSCEGKQSLDDIVKPFKNYYMNAVGTIFLMKLSIFLWSLLFFIPGIIKSYAYEFVPHLLEDEPNLSYSEILRKSEEMTRGIKMDLFILDLSFIGWNLLDLVSFGLAKFFVSPYVHVTKAAVYLQVRNQQYHG